MWMRLVGYTPGGDEWMAYTPESYGWMLEKLLALWSVYLYALGRKSPKQFPSLSREQARIVAGTVSIKPSFYRKRDLAPVSLFDCHGNLDIEALSEMVKDLLA